MEKRSFALMEVRFLERGKKNPPENDDDDEIDDDEDDEDDEERAQIMDGYASVFNRDSEDLGGFVEQIAPGAFTRSLSQAANGDLNIQALWSHDWSQPLGSTRGGKLQLSQDHNGLKVSLDTKRMTPAQLDALKDGDMRMSFGFMVRDDDWSKRDGVNVRTIKDVDLLEVSPVALPAYPDTSAALRSLAEWEKRTPIDPNDKYSATNHRLNALLGIIERQLEAKGKI